jgi:hypothetical protein
MPDGKFIEASQPPIASGFAALCDNQNVERASRERDRTQRCEDDAR